MRRNGDSMIIEKDKIEELTDSLVKCNVDSFNTYILCECMKKYYKVENTDEILDRFNEKYFSCFADVQDIQLGDGVDFYSDDVSYFTVKDNDNYDWWRDFKNNCRQSIRKIIENHLEVK